MQAWHECYGDKGLTVIGVHTPEFAFAQYESNVERGIREFGLTYPIVIDSNREIWKAFANRYWPTKYLLDKDGYLRYGHFGEGGYGECEQVIQELLREMDANMTLPVLMDPLREEDHAGAVCYRASGELYLGHRRGRIGNEGGFKEDQIADYSFAGKLEENFFYTQGRWASTGEYFEAAEEGPHVLKVRYEAAAVNLVMASPRGSSAEVIVVQDGKPLTRKQATRDTRFRNPSQSAGAEGSYSVNTNLNFTVPPALRPSPSPSPVALTRLRALCRLLRLQAYEARRRSPHRKGWQAPGLPAHATPDHAAQVGVPRRKDRRG